MQTPWLEQLAKHADKSPVYVIKMLLFARVEILISIVVLWDEIELIFVVGNDDDDGIIWIEYEAICEEAFVVVDIKVLMIEEFVVNVVVFIAVDESTNYFF